MTFGLIPEPFGRGRKKSCMKKYIFVFIFFILGNFHFCLFSQVCFRGKSNFEVSEKFLILMVLFCLYTWSIFRMYRRLVMTIPFLCLFIWSIFRMCYRLTPLHTNQKPIFIVEKLPIFPFNLTRDKPPTLF